jgi:gamma-glutamylcyclotransferase
MYYFAYASNLSRKQMSERCPNNKPKFIATLPNHKLIFAGWSRKWHGGIASIKPTTGEKVIGAVYEVTEGCLANLDKHEGLKYRRKPVIVFTEDNGSVEAVTYIMLEQSEETKPTLEYLAVIKQGYRDWGIV